MKSPLVAEASLMLTDPVSSFWEYKKTIFTGLPPSLPRT